MLSCKVNFQVPGQRTSELTKGVLCPFCAVYKELLILESFAFSDDWQTYGDKKRRGKEDA
ncbi:hypothetical protein ACH95_01775 [Bacillus glycinifermentans]|nr:hypothetical protein ACH95_01775 [Bacillus glycinifermentans]